MIDSSDNDNTLASKPCVISEPNSNNCDQSSATPDVTDKSLEDSSTRNHKCNGESKIETDEQNHARALAADNCTTEHTTREFKSSNSSKKRAVFIAIAYKRTPQELKGCVNDQERLYRFVKNLSPDCETRVLCDDKNTSLSVHGQPTRANILEAIRWLRQGQQLWFSFSGHGHWRADRSRNLDEEDKRDETIVPVDFEKNGQIVDDELRKELVDELNDGATLTALFDCCHSGTALDLHCTFLDDSKYIGPRFLRKPNTYEPSQWRRRLIYERHEGAKPTEKSNVCMWSGCRDTEVSADAQISGKHSGAMTHAFLHFNDSTQKGYKLRNSAADNVHSPANLLQDMNGWLKAEKYTQRPQLSFGKPVNVDEPWNIFKD